ncbi:MAG TPA: dihydrofolate reductase family protein [Candidatus Dormibacteraeota bacterium]|nr:dihydrofolate reductase family protein [Candidatus Dormibacteraeota bacterium]
MAKVIVALSMSLDGYIAGANDGAEQPLGEGGMRLFDWYFEGDTPIRRYEEAGARGVPVPPFRLSRPSAEVFEELAESGGAAVTGRRTYDIAGAWGGNGPLPGIPTFVVTHHVPDRVPRGESVYTFVTDGVESAVAQARAVAGDGYVSLMGSAVPRECLRLGLLDEIQIHLVPVLLGGGVRLFDHLGGSVQLELVRVVDAPGVTHLRYRVVR